jgi:hypothetical protein
LVSPANHPLHRLLHNHYHHPSSGAGKRGQ